MCSKRVSFIIYSFLIYSKKQSVGNYVKFFKEKLYFSGNGLVLSELEISDAEMTLSVQPAGSTTVKKNVVVKYWM